MKRTKSNYLGIDIGSVSISIAEINSDHRVVKSAYEFHKGEIKKTLDSLLKDFCSEDIYKIGITSGSPDIIVQGKKYDSKLCFISAAKQFNNSVKNLLMVGGETFGLITFDDQGNYQSYLSNTSCAAGTGSFLDQQAKRLNLDSIADFSEIAFNNKNDYPKIASRCSVFAKTDLIHAQQEGYSLDEICDGLCAGMAKNICDTLFNNNMPEDDIFLAGGVSRNKAVKKHISSLLNVNVITDEYTHLYGAIGAAFSALEDESAEVISINSIDELINSNEKQKEHHYDPLKLEISSYPDFSSLNRYEYTSSIYKMATPVEIDIYEKLSVDECGSLYLGIDIGSTSTKATIINNDNKVLIGFYTRTSGRPLEAVQTIFESINDIESQHNIKFNFSGVGTTGSGRKFIGQIINSDIALDEITAHARAAYELDSEVDTIIEIGGQDAKFTTLKNGNVTFSIMNNVCAAGTGSFIEEQAKKLNCPLSKYSSMAENVKAPLASDRCTVFMERDINHYLNEGYEVKEILASVLHSVRENYIHKVAIEKNIGDKIFFQGATAKNRALVAAFEQKLKKPIMVSKFCHLTGALGVALHLSDNNAKESTFKGIDLYKNSIPISQEICEVCTNHCKLKIAEVGDEKVAYGFLCGKDYNETKFVNVNKSGFDLLKSRNKVFSFKKDPVKDDDFTIGLPASLHLFDEIPLWEKFFNLLGVKTVNSVNYKDGIKEGKKITGAEFCAPITNMHGHVKYLVDKSDFIFMPIYLENNCERKNTRRHYCYYTQFAPSVISSIEKINPDKNKILTPLIKSLKSKFNTRVQLYKALKPVLKNRVSFIQVSSAFDRALKFHSASQEKLKETFNLEHNDKDKMNVVLFGRPYTILSNSMNKNIPEIFSKLGIKTFFQDMITSTEKDNEKISSMLDDFHWHYAAKIMEAANVVATTPGLYPVLVTSFKCSPDAFVMDYFKKIFDTHNKPYLILQLDDHGSNVGYETRIEAGVRSFKNHFNDKLIEEITDLDMDYKISTDINALKKKTVLLPNWDTISSRLIAAQLQSLGIDARPLRETKGTIQRGLKFNTGQCIPMTAIVQEAIEFIDEENLDPASTTLWMFESSISCNVKMYPSFLKKSLEEYGNGFEKVEVYIGDITNKDISLKAAIDSYLANMFAGLIRKIACKLRPYEIEKGITNSVVEKSIQLLEKTFLEKSSKEEAVKKVISMFEDIKINKTNKPKVAIFGDLYVRDNDVMNQGLIQTIEDNGGEAITTPYSEYLKIISDQYIKKWFSEGEIGESAMATLLKKIILLIENKYYKYFNKILKEDNTNYKVDYGELLSKFNVKIEHTGESMDNILKINSLMKHYPDISLFVQTNPAYCCPSYVTEAMKDKLEKFTGVPIIILEYDGTGGNKNSDIVPYLKYPRVKTVDKKQIEQNA